LRHNLVWIFPLVAIALWGGVYTWYFLNLRHRIVTKARGKAQRERKQALKYARK
jgi:hypothetical protein